MLHEKHGGTADPQELLKLHPGEDINIVQRLVPHIQVGALAQAAGKKHLLFLPGAIIGQILFKLYPREVQLAENGLELCLVQFIAPRELAQAAPQEGGVLGRSEERRVGKECRL